MSVKDWETAARKLSDALLTLRPLGGSECVSRHFIDGQEVYLADTDYFRRIIREKHDDLREANISLRRMARDEG